MRTPWRDPGAGGQFARPLAREAGLGCAALPSSSRVGAGKGRSGGAGGMPKLGGGEMRCRGDLSVTILCRCGPTPSSQNSISKPMLPEQARPARLEKCRAGDPLGTPKHQPAPSWRRNRLLFLCLRNAVAFCVSRTVLEMCTVYKTSAPTRIPGHICTNHRPPEEQTNRTRNPVKEGKYVNKEEPEGECWSLNVWGMLRALTAELKQQLWK